MLVSSNYSSKAFAFFVGAIFLLVYWVIGYDGITFSDDVYYLIAGKKFWEGSMQINSHHFSSRWGAYGPAGFLGMVVGFDPHRVSLISGLSYVISLGFLIRILPKESNPILLSLWFCTQVFFLHFLTKVYPDSLLILWVSLIGFSAIYRQKQPIWAAFGIIAGLFIGFMTKETIVFLAPFPFFLALWDWKKSQFSMPFYGSVMGFGVLVLALYLGYFAWFYGDPLYRISSINAGHYISEYTYADKGLSAILRRITYLPFLTFVERGYWLWLVMSIPGVLFAWKKGQNEGVVFSLLSGCLLLGFWLMSSTLAFYNPIYLNPRHLIILIPGLAFLIALGWNFWEENQSLKKLLLILLALGIGISLFQQDWKMAGFQLAIGTVLFWNKVQMKLPIIAILLLVPSLAAVRYQKTIKDYNGFMDSLVKNIEDSKNQTPILTHNFIHFSRQVLVLEDTTRQKLLLPIEKLDSLKPHLPSEIRVFLYDYYKHAYPKEQEDVNRLEQFLLENYIQVEVRQEGLTNTRRFQKRN